ncbi:MAG: DNA-3-methyladenine glycosylase 2 [Thermoanaerobaculaceae bacterium]|nr:DNA-3-methyladenine glycosylase 2 [Thermoanaerobaculaceae bacterium]TAM52210.1 MAG: DNA-3-methyladenine glycosylase 2 [Acidobacteriota bacterium]
MRAEPDPRYQALRARDSRFDGRFFVGVSSTKIYCRPVCAARTPKRENCRFFPSAAAAEASGYRPCLRCRPELAPGNASVDARSRIAHAAADLIEDGLLNDAPVDALATRLGITDRHLRRVFRSEYGVSPIRYAQTQRLLMAKRLLTETSLPVIEVAMASGFGSLRRFNALFRTRYRLSPTALRNEAGENVQADGVTLQLAFRPPFSWAALAGFLGPRAVAGVEHVCDGAYRRTVRVTRQGREFRGWVEVRPAPARPALAVTIDVALCKALPQVLARIRRLFDLSCNPMEIAGALGRLARPDPGVRVPGAFDGFELAVRAVLGQQVTVKGARTLAGRFARAFGEPVATPFPGLDVVFPTPETVARLEPSAIAELGIVGARARSIIALATELAAGTLRLDPGVEIEPALAALRRIPGIGEWTAQYIAMRALSWPDAFPHTDLGVRKALGAASPAGVLRAGEEWRPWRAYAVMHLWRSLEERP